MTKKIPLLTNDLASAIRSQASLQIVLPPKDMTFDVYLEVDDKLHEKIKNSSVLSEKVFLEVSKVYKLAVQQLVKEAERIEKEFFRKGKSKDWVRKEWEKSAPPILNKFEPILQKKAEAQLANWQKVQGDATKYVIKCVFKTAVGTLGVATATLGTIVAFGAGGGAGAGVAIYGLYKAILSLGKEVNNLRKDVDQAETELQNYGSSLMVTYRKASKGKVVGREFLTEFFNGLSPKEVKNINGLNTKYDLFKGKLDRVEKKLDALGTKLNELLDEQEKMDKVIDAKIQKQLTQRGYKSKKLPKLMKTMRKSRFEVSKKIAQVGEGIGKVDKARKRERGYKTAINELNQKKPGWAAKVEKLIVLGDLALGAGFTDFSKMDQLLVLIDSVVVEIDGVLAEEI